MQTKFIDTKSSDSFVYTTNYDIYTSLGSFLEIQNGVVAITVGICRDQQNHNFFKYTYEYYTNR